MRTIVRRNALFRFSPYFRQIPPQRTLWCLRQICWRYSILVRACPSEVFAFWCAPAISVCRSRHWRLAVWTRAVGTRLCYCLPLKSNVRVYCRCYTVRYLFLLPRTFDLRYWRLLCVFENVLSAASIGVRVVRRYELCLFYLYFIWDAVLVDDQGCWT